MNRITPHDVAALARLNAAINQYNKAQLETDEEYIPLDARLCGPHNGWMVEIVNAYTYTQVARGMGNTLGDAIIAAMKAWKEARDDR